MITFLVEVYPDVVISHCIGGPASVADKVLIVGAGDDKLTDELLPSVHHPDVQLPRGVPQRLPLPVPEYLVIIQTRLYATTQHHALTLLSVLFLQ